MSSFLYRLFFTRDDDLDLLQAFFLVAIMFFIIAFTLAGLGVWKVTTAAWATFGSVFAILAIAGTPVWVAKLIATSKTPGEVASGIAQSEGRAFGASTFEYDVDELLRDDE